ncbi:MULTISPECIES: YceI family protein [unclassified Rhodanobacter]|uniref:YceI family protein n=1 Tax=unclassified Rhodanobacter TaxID=2621553 RepID=UPI001BDE1D64|nr:MULTISPECIES: YceI family protein [unclassified Rhodanobacter]MBT2144440.1 YceI family protein [Rhodanobacter sp. LX-99]MBT2149893.1 YceI family protein [Rhodanobacter sp. LX-100]
MRALKYLAFAGLLGAAVSAQAAPVTYKLDPGHTMVLFSWNHFGYSNPTADLGLGEGTLVFDEQHPANSSVEVTLPLARLDTHVPALDEHLKKPDFLDADQYPVVTFKSTEVQPLGGNKFKVTGNLTVHGVTRPVVLDATLNKVGPHPMTKAPSIGFDATASIKRSDFGVGAYVPNVSDELSIRITTEASVPKKIAAK